MRLVGNEPYLPSEMVLWKVGHGAGAWEVGDLRVWHNLENAHRLVGKPQGNPLIGLDCFSTRHLELVVDVGCLRFSTIKKLKRRFTSVSPAMVPHTQRLTEVTNQGTQKASSPTIIFMVI